MGLFDGVQFGASILQLAALFWFARYYITNISSGEWVPKRELDYVRGDRDARLAEKDAQIARSDERAAEWQAALYTSEQTRELQSGHIRDLIDAVRPMERFLDAFRGLLERDERDRGDDSGDP